MFDKQLKNYFLWQKLHPRRFNEARSLPQLCIIQSNECKHFFREDLKRRTLAGNCGVAVFAIAFVCIAVAFTTPSWLVSDYRITGAKLDRLGLWVHCFRSLPDVNDDYQRRFFVGCRWVYDPFTTGYDEIRGFLIPRKFDEPERGLVNKLIVSFYALYSFHDNHSVLLHAGVYCNFRLADSGAALLPMWWTRSETFSSYDKGEKVKLLMKIIL